MKQYLKLNLLEIDSLMKFNGMEIKVFLYFISNFQQDNIFHLFGQRNNICELIGCTSKSLNSTLAKMVENNIACKITRDSYMFNPDFLNRVKNSYFDELRIKYLEYQGYEVVGENSFCYIYRKKKTE